MRCSGWKGIRSTRPRPPKRVRHLGGRDGSQRTGEADGSASPRSVAEWILSVHEMIRPLAALPLFVALAQTPLDTDTFTRDQVNGQLGTRLDSQLTRFAEYGFSGTVLVVRDGRVVLLKGYGQANVERGIRHTATTRFEMNSMTKMFTGVAILQLAAEGRLRLNDPVARYLDGLPPAKQGATIEQLATHTSGLIPEGTDLAGNSREAFVRDIGRSPVESAPGERYRYSNAGFSLLAAIIETVSGETYEQYLRRRLFAPAGMQTATFRDEVSFDDPLFAHGYIGTPAALEPGPPNPYAWGTRGAGGVWATVGDIYRWLVAVDGRRVPVGGTMAPTDRTTAPSGERGVWMARGDCTGRSAANPEGRRVRRLCEPSAVLSRRTPGHRLGEQQLAPTVASDAQPRHPGPASREYAAVSSAGCGGGRRDDRCACRTLPFEWHHARAASGSWIPVRHSKSSRHSDTRDVLSSGCRPLHGVRPTTPRCHASRVQWD